MKEVLTKSFWQGVTKTFYEALEDPPLKEGPSKSPAADKADPSPASETSASPSPSSEQTSQRPES
jgi:hypothetical protein